MFSMANRIGPLGGLRLVFRSLNSSGNNTLPATSHGGPAEHLATYVVTAGQPASGPFPLPCGFIRLIPEVRQLFSPITQLPLALKPKVCSQCCSELAAELGQTIELTQTTLQQLAQKA